MNEDVSVHVLDNVQKAEVKDFLLLLGKRFKRHVLVLFRVDRGWSRSTKETNAIVDGKVEKGEVQVVDSPQAFLADVLIIMTAQMGFKRQQGFGPDVFICTLQCFGQIGQEQAGEEMTFAKVLFERRDALKGRPKGAAKR